MPTVDTKIKDKRPRDSDKQTKRQTDKSDKETRDQETVTNRPGDSDKETETKRHETDKQRDMETDGQRYEDRRTDRD